MASLSSRLEALARNRTAVIGSGAGVVLVYLAWRQLRAQQAPIIVSAPASASAADTGATDLSAFQAGASAAGMGYDFGQAALGLAGSAVTDLGGVASTLAGSQADMGSTLSGALSDAIGKLTAPAPSITTTTTTPPAGGTPVPPRWWPSTLATPPSSAVGWIQVASGSLNYYSVSGTTAKPVGTMSGGFPDYVDRVLAVQLAAGGSTTLVHLVKHAKWIGKSRGAYHAKA